MLSLNSATERQNAIIAAFGPKLETILTFCPRDAGSVDSADKVGYDFGLDVTLAPQQLKSPQDTQAWRPPNNRLPYRADSSSKQD
jgi:hypothetical protein